MRPNFLVFPGFLLPCAMGIKASFEFKSHRYRHSKLGLIKDFVFPVRRSQTKPRQFPVCVWAKFHFASVCWVSRPSLEPKFDRLEADSTERGNEVGGS